LFSRTGSPTLIHQFGESVTYYPAGDTSAGRTIEAMIEREVAGIDQAGDAMVFATVVRVRDDNTLGISATEIDTGADLLGLAMRVGESQRIKQIVRVLSTENGLVRFEVN